MDVKETKLFCAEFKADETHNVMILVHNGCYDCYLMEHDETGETPYMFMFGLPIKQQSYSEAIEIAAANAKNYSWLFEDSNEE